MSVKKTDYLIQRGIEKVNIQRAVKINDKSQNLTIELKLNHKKGLYEIAMKWNYDAVTEDDVLDRATIKVMGDLMMEGRNYCIDWREKWLEAQPKENPEDKDQLSMGFGGDGGVDDEMEAGAA